MKERMRREKWRERGGGECEEKRAMERRKRRREREERRTNPTQVSLEAAGRTTEGPTAPPCGQSAGRRLIGPSLVCLFGYKTVQEEIRSSLDSSYLHVKYTTFSVLLNTAEHAFV